MPTVQKNVRKKVVVFIQICGLCYYIPLLVVRVEKV